MRERKWMSEWTNLGVRKLNYSFFPRSSSISLPFLSLIMIERESFFKSFSNVWRLAQDGWCGSQHHVEQDEGIRIVKQWVIEIFRWERRESRREKLRERMFCWVIENQRFIIVSKEAVLAANDLSLATSRADSSIHSSFMTLEAHAHVYLNNTFHTDYIHISCSLHRHKQTQSSSHFHRYIWFTAYSLHPSIFLRIFGTIISDIVIFVSHHSTNFGRFQSKSHFWESR